VKRFFSKADSVRLGTYTRARAIAFVTAIALLTIPNVSLALEPPPPKGGPKIKTGFGLMVIGTIATGFGAAVYIANENSGKTTCTACAKSSWVLPTVLMSLGGAMFVTGGTIFTIGLVENSRSSAPTASLHLGPFGASARVLF